VLIGGGGGGIGADFPGAVGANAPIGKGSGVHAPRGKIDEFIIYQVYFFHLILSGFYPRNAMLARVFATATCLSVRLSLRHEPLLYQNEES